MRFSEGGSSRHSPWSPKPYAIRWGGGGCSAEPAVGAVYLKTSFSVNGALLDFFSFPKGGPGPPGPPALNRPLKGTVINGTRHL